MPKTFGCSGILGSPTRSPKISPERIAAMRRFLPSTVLHGEGVPIKRAG